MNHIRIISPSGAIAPELIDGARRQLESWGYEVTEGVHARGKEGRFAASDDERVQDINDALADEQVDIILCARGGYGLQRIIDRVDLRPLAHRQPPMVVGFSDITELHLLLNGHGIATMHGLMCKHLCELRENSMMVYAWRAALAGETLSYQLPAHPLNRNGQSTGILVGGNLSVIYGLQGTPYSIAPIVKSRPCILFIEDIAERHYHIDRMIQNLRMSGVLSHLTGLIVGQFSDCDNDEGMGETIMQTILRAVQDYDYPVVFGFPAGHVESNMPLMMGQTATMSVQDEQVRLIYAKV